MIPITPQRLLNYLAFHYFLTMNVPVEGYSRHAQCAHNIRYKRLYNEGTRKLIDYILSLDTNAALSMPVCLDCDN